MYNLKIFHLSYISHPQISPMHTSLCRLPSYVMQGKPGIPGPQGFVGADGRKGDRGEPGIRGEPGAEGRPGATGQMGPSGLIGVNGIAVCVYMFLQSTSLFA